MKTLLPRLYLITVFSFFSFDDVAQFVQTTGPEGSTVHCLVQDCSNMYAATFGGIFRTADHGSTWIPLNATGQIPDQLRAHINYLAEDDTYLYASTEPVGVFRSQDHGFSWTHWENGLPQQTAIPVLYFVEETLLAGTYQVDWDASGFSSGIYYYRIKAGEYQAVKKTILLR
jgi:hypothetical protein